MEEPKTFWDIFKSRKFWVLALALVIATGALAAGKLDGWQYTQAVIIALAAYSTGVAIEDAGSKAGAGLAAGRNAAATLPSPLAPLPGGEGEAVKQSNSRITGPPDVDYIITGRKK